MTLAGPYGSLSFEHVPRFRDSAANAVWFHGFSAEHFERCVAADAAACVEFRTFRANYDERPELVPIGVDGNPIRRGRLLQGVCLSQTDFTAEREAELEAGMVDFSPTGVWLDYLTYAGWFETPEPDLQESCFCAECVREFCESTGIDESDPGAILASHADAWTRHKCDRIVDHGRRFASIIREARPDAIVGLYACPWEPAEFDGALTRIFAQDLDRLAGICDVVSPLHYATKSGRSDDWVMQYMSRCREFVPPSARVEPIVDALDLPGNLEAIAMAATEMPTGLQVFAGDSVFANPDLVALFDRAVSALATGA